MKRVFVYGDSNVWGDNVNGPRVVYHLRWVNRLKRAFAGKYHIVSDGVCGRIAGDYRTDKPHRNGKSSFLNALQKASPVDILIVALGTNDLQQKFARSADAIVKDLQWYAEVAGVKNVLYILPPNFDSESGDAGPEFTSDSQAVRSQLLALKSKLPQTIVVDDIQLSDGVHFSPKGHKQMFDRVAEFLRKEIM